MNNKINPKLYKRVVGYGCSYTAGDEIADHLILNISFEECKKLKKKFSNQTQFYNHYNIVHQHEMLWSNSWAAQLANLINLPYLNRATPGSSIGHIYFDIYKDYVNKLISKDDLILVGITEPSRIMYWDEESSKLDSCPLSHYLQKLDKQSGMAVSDLCSDNILIFSYFCHLQNISNLKNILDIRLQYMCPEPILDIKRPGGPFKITKVVDNILIHMYKDIDNILLKNDNLQDSYLEIVGHCGYGHPPLESHTNLAQKIYKECVIEYTINT